VLTPPPSLLRGVSAILHTPGLAILPSGAPLGAEIVGVNLAEDLDEPTFRAIEAASVL
jgi:alpha-ketoglutarate-dependent taurine dioxygenase